MPRSNNQKGKLIHLLRTFFYETDEEHPIGVPGLIQELEQEGVKAERKSIYDDVEQLRYLGYDIQFQRGRGYYVGERMFELAELKLLVDAVQSSKFITLRKSRALISKLEQLTSRHQGSSLQRQVFVAGRVRSMNESIYYNIDALHQAINENHRITFQYYKYDRRRVKQLRHDGQRYELSPCALMRSDDNYYLVGYDSSRQELRHYRVDKMQSIQLKKSPREGMELFSQLDLARYARVHFNMFRGREYMVQLRCHNDMADVMLDRFGDQLTMVPEGEDYFTSMVEAAVSPQFFGWLFGLGDKVEIQAPAQVRQEYADYLRRQLAVYEEPGAGKVCGEKTEHSL